MQTSKAIHPKLFVVLTHGVGLGVVALTAALVLFVGYRPLRVQQDTDEQRITQLMALLDNSIETRRAHVQLRRQLDELTERILRSRRLTPQRAEDSRFLAEASRIASDAGIVVEDFRSSSPRVLPTHSELDVTLAGAGSHKSICRFLDSVEGVSRAKQIKRLDIESDDDPGAYPVEITYTLHFGLKTDDPSSGDEGPES